MKAIVYSILLPSILALVSYKVFSEQHLHVLAIKGDFSQKMINKISENLGVEVHVTFAENRFEKHDKLIRSNGIDYDIIYESGRYIKGLRRSRWIAPVSELEETGRIRLWKSGIFGILRKKEMPNVNWSELFDFCGELIGRIQLTDSGIINSMIASESINPSVETLLELKEGVFSQCKFSILPTTKSQQLDRIVQGDISYAVVDNEQAHSFLAVSDEIEFYIPSGQKFGWSKQWIVLNSSRNKELAKKFLDEVSRPEIKVIEANLRYSSFPDFHYKPNSILALSKSYSDKIQISVSDFNKARAYQEIQFEIVENSGE